MSAQIPSIVQQVQGGSRTATDIVTEALDRAEKHQAYNALISTSRERALERAATIDAAVAAGKGAGPLAGVPFVAKDNFVSFGSETTAASNILRGFQAPYQSTAIERLEAAGAICIGKANLDAFGHGGSTEHSDFERTLHPEDQTRVPGGSSGGSAAAVALDIVPFALGTDTGGSIRLPASFCGVVGYKPSYGLVSRYGVVAMASSTDTIGPLCRSAEDAAMVIDIMMGRDPLDATTLDHAPGELRDVYQLQTSKKKSFRIGVVAECMGEGVEPGTRKAIEEKLASLTANGHIVEEISLPAVEMALAVYYVVVPAEISSNLARYDGIRYGYSDPSARSLAETYEQSRSKGLNDENIRRVMIGNYVLSSGYYDAYYRKAQTVRTKLINEFTEAFKQYDLLAMPTSPEPAFVAGEKSDPLTMYMLDKMNVPASLAGLPAISVPAGNSDGLPVGLQLIGAYDHDRDVLAFAVHEERD